MVLVKLSYKVCVCFCFFILILFASMFTLYHLFCVFSPDFGCREKTNLNRDDAISWLRGELKLTKKENRVGSGIEGGGFLLFFGCNWYCLFSEKNDYHFKFDVSWKRFITFFLFCKKSGILGEGHSTLREFLEVRNCACVCVCVERDFKWGVCDSFNSCSCV